MLPPQRFALLSVNRYLLPIALLCAAGLCALAPQTWLRLSALSAALLTLLNAAADQPDEAPTPTTQGWRSRSRQLRLRPSPGHGAWKASVRRD